MVLVFYTLKRVQYGDILSVDKFCLWKNCITVITHFHIDYKCDSSNRLLLAKDKEGTMISYVFHGKYYKGKCQMHALQYSYQPDSLLCELLFSPFSFRNTASGFFPYYCFRFSAFACSSNSGFFSYLFS